MGENRKYNNTITINKIGKKYRKYKKNNTNTINKIGRKYRKYKNTIQLQVIRWEIQGNTEGRREKKIHKKHENITTNTAQKLQNRFTSQGNVTFTEGSQVQPYNHVKKTSISICQKVTH